MSNQDEILGYCIECKEPIMLEDDYVKDNGKVFCIFCYKIKNNIIEELDFEE